MTNAYATTMFDTNQSGIQSFQPQDYGLNTSMYTANNFNTPIQQAPLGLFSAPAMSGNSDMFTGSFLDPNRFGVGNLDGASTQPQQASPVGGMSPMDMFNIAQGALGMFMGNRQMDRDYSLGKRQVGVQEGRLDLLNKQYGAREARRNRNQTV